MKVLFQNRWRKKTEEELADPGSPGKQLLKLRRRWWWQGCSLGLDVSVSRRSFQTSRSRLGLVETWEGLGLDLVSD